MHHAIGLIVSVSSDSVAITTAFCLTSSFFCRRYSQWKNEIKQTTRITEKTAKIYTGTKQKQDKDLKHL